MLGPSWGRPSWGEPQLDPTPLSCICSHSMRRQDFGFSFGSQALILSKFSRSQFLFFLSLKNFFIIIYWGFFLLIDAFIGCFFYVP